MRITALGTKVGLCGICLAAALGIGGCFRKPPELTRPGAAVLISQARQFNESRVLVSVDAVGVGPQSQSNFALAVFEFREKQAGTSGAAIKATAQFNYRAGQWHVGMFRYGEGWNGVAVQVDQ